MEKTADDRVQELKSMIRKLHRKRQAHYHTLGINVVLKNTIKRLTTQLEDERRKREVERRTYRQVRSPRSPLGNPVAHYWSRIR